MVPGNPGILEAIMDSVLQSFQINVSLRRRRYRSSWVELRGVSCE